MAQHFVGKYQKTINVEGCTAVLTGVRRETLLKGTEKEPMPTAYDMPRGKVFMGSAIARALGKKTGDPVVLLGKTFAVAKVLPEAGVSPEDIRIFAHLRDVQELLGKPGRINAIDALACRCPENVNSVVAALDKSIREALPDVNVQPYRSILLARHEQRSMMRRLELAALAIVLIGAAVSIWVLTGQNVRQRRYELGVLRALGVAGWRIAALFIGKILIYSAVGAALGPILGLLAAHWFNATDRPILTPWDIFVAILVITPVAAVLFGLPPIAGGLAQEPVDLLRNGEV
jgi:putative ABC transport system permease protein